MKQAKQPHRIYRVIRCIYTPDHTEDIWNDTTIEITPSKYPNAFYLDKSYIKPRLKARSTRRRPYKKLSNRQLKLKLYAAGLRRTNLKCVLQKIQSLISTKSETTNYDIEALYNELSKKLVRRLTKFIKIRYIVLDEFWNMTRPNSIQNYFSASRKQNVHTITVTQTLADLN